MGKYLTLDKNFNGLLSDNIEDYPEGIVILLDKPYQWTSADAVRKIKFRLQNHFHNKKIKVGHAGTLDPLATGILLICVGKATKMAETLQSHEKEYIATMEFGATTPSYDLEKEIDTFFPHEHITYKDIEHSIKQFIGEQEQIPPIFSAKLIDGVRAYELARAGEEVTMRPSTISISEIELLSFERPTERPIAKIRIKCSKGTYIRAFARDLGLALGSGGYLTALTRTKSGNFNIDDSVQMTSINSFLSK